MACKRQFNRWKRQLLKEFPETNYAALQRPKDVGAMLRAVSTVPGEQTRLAIEAIAYMAVRSGELRGSSWGEFDLESDKPIWVIPAARMKARREHQVPLSRQAVEKLKALRQLCKSAKSSDRVLPGRIDPRKPISDMTLSMAFRRIGYEGKQTVHGLRAIFSTLMREQSRFRPQAIEVQLAHAVKDPTEAAYNRAMYIDERREMMQFYADYLDGLRNKTHQESTALQSEAETA